MTVERRIRDALSELDQVEPSIDLWARVTESIETDKAHRRRVWRMVAAVAVVTAALFVAGWLSISETTLGHLAVDWRVMELIETVALAMLVFVLGPAVRRLGDGYAGEVFRANPTTGASFLRLLDVAYYLVFVGYLLSTTQLVAPGLLSLTIGDQLQATAGRLGGLLMVMGLLHAMTFIGLPLLGLVFTSVWRQRKLARLVNVILVAISVPAALVVLFLIVGTVP